MLACVAPPQRLLRPPCRSIRTFSTSVTRLARPAKTPAVPLRKKGVGAVPIPRSTPQTTVLPSRPSLGMKTSQQFYARRLYDAGVREVYREGSKSRILAAWLIGGCFIANTLVLFSLRNWDDKKLTGMGAWQRGFVAGANRVGMFALTVVGGFIIFRYLGSIRLIRLVDAGGSRVNFDVHIRRRLPWSGIRYTVDPGDLLMPKGWRYNIIPQTPPESTRNLSAALGTPFQWLKSWMLMERIVTPVRLDKDTAGFLDGDGTFSVSLDEFNSMTSESRQ